MAAGSAAGAGSGASSVGASLTGASAGVSTAGVAAFSLALVSRFFLRPKPRLRLGSSRFGSLPLVSGSVGMSGFCHSSTAIQAHLPAGLTTA